MTCFPRPAFKWVALTGLCLHSVGSSIFLSFKPRILHSRTSNCKSFLKFPFTFARCKCIHIFTCVCFLLLSLETWDWLLNAQNDCFWEDRWDIVIFLLLHIFFIVISFRHRCTPDLNIMVTRIWLIGEWISEWLNLWKKLNEEIILGYF